MRDIGEFVVVVGVGPATKGKYKVPADTGVWVTEPVNGASETDQALFQRGRIPIRDCSAGENVYIVTPQIGGELAPMPWCVTAEEADDSIPLFPGMGPDWLALRRHVQNREEEDSACPKGGVHDRPSREACRRMSDAARIQRSVEQTTGECSKCRREEKLWDDGELEP